MFSENLKNFRFRQLANVITTSSGDRKIPVVASRGTASWVDEEGQIPESDDSFGQVSIGAFKLATMIKVSEELLNDSVFNLESYIAREFARRIGAKEEEAFFVGDGLGKPTGILAATGGGQVGATTAAAAAITLDEILDLFYSLKSPYRKKAVFVMNDATVKAIRKGQGTRPLVPHNFRCLIIKYGVPLIPQEKGKPHSGNSYCQECSNDPGLQPTHFLF
jgi:HK97 family phage major capsid protein